MATHCFIPMLGKRLRVTELDECGSTFTGAKQVVTDGFITITISSETEDGTEILTKNAAGAICVNEKMADSFKRFTVEVEFCGVNPDLLGIVSNVTPYADAAGDIAGFTVGEGEMTKAFALELWMGMAGQACAPGQTGQASAYMLLPFVRAGVLGDITIDGENAVTFSVTNSATVGGNNWGVGPFDVVYGLGTPTIQELDITGAPTGGDFTLTFKGQTTAAIDWDATASDVEAALEALSTVGAGNVVVTGGALPGTPVVITFQGALGNTPQPAITSTDALTGGTTPATGITVTQAGALGSPSPLPTPIDQFDHLLLVDTALAFPPVACAATTLQ